jgi:hypothetical protein
VLALVLLLAARPMMSIATQFLAAAILVASVGWALTRTTRPELEVVTLAVSNASALAHRCRALGHLLAEAPSLRRVEIDLGDRFLADRSSISLLTFTRQRLEEADVRLSISAAPAVAKLLMASGLPASMRGDLAERSPLSDALHLHVYCRGYPRKCTRRPRPRHESRRSHWTKRRHGKRS